MKTKLTKTQKMIADIILIVITVLISVLIIARTNSFNSRITMQQTVVVEDGKVISEPVVNFFDLKHSGNYSIAAKWWPEENPGFVSGLVVTDADGEEIFICTGDKVNAASEKMKLDKGTYEIRFVFLHLLRNWMLLLRNTIYPF